MRPAENLIRSLSDTALWTAAYRAEESERRDAIFHDPYARRLAGERGFTIAGAVNNPTVRIGVTLRTAAIDRFVLSAVHERGCDCVLDLAAGLDTRAWRLELPRELTWIDADLPEIDTYKSEILAAETPACTYRAVALDLANRTARRALFARVNDESQRVLVLTEGLLSYLEPTAVGELATDLAAEPHFAEWVTEIAGAQVASRAGGAGARLNPRVAQTRFTPADNTLFFVPFGWREAEHIDLFLSGHELGRDSLVGKALRTAVALFPAKARLGFERVMGVARLERARS